MIEGLNPDLLAFVGLVLISLGFGVVMGLASRALDHTSRAPSHTS